MISIRVITKFNSNYLFITESESKITELFGQK
jgi:hypothetical protein